MIVIIVQQFSIKEKAPGAGTPRRHHHPLAPSFGRQEPRRKDGQMNSSTQDNLYELSGRARIRAMFHPRQRIGLIEAGKLIGLSYPQLHRRLQQGKLALQIQRDEFAHMFVTIDDLAAYLYPDHADDHACPVSSPPPLPKIKSGRPRKSITNDGTKGGVR